MLKDYRLPFFKRFAMRYDTVFCFNYASSLEVDLVEPKIIHTNLRERLTLKDIITLYNNIKSSDIYISSFILNPFTLWGVFFTKLLKKKSIVWEEINYLPTDSVKWTIKEAILRLASIFMDAFFVLGEVQATTLHSLGVPSKKVFVANEYPGVIFANIAEIPFPLPVREGNKFFLYLGRLIEVKGVEYLLRAFNLFRSEISGVELLIVGDGDLDCSLKSLKNELSLDEVHFLGPIYDIYQKAFLLKNCAALIVPSIMTMKGQHEGGPLVVLEALSAGAAVIGTEELGSSTKFIQNGINGYVVPAKDYPALYRSMVEYIRRPIPKEMVFDTFNKINSFSYQAQIMDRAIHFVSQPPVN